MRVKPKDIVLVYKRKGSISLAANELGIHPTTSQSLTSQERQSIQTWASQTCLANKLGFWRSRV